MMSIGWSLVEIAAHLLEAGEREAVLGDLVEAGETPLQGSLEVLGLVIRRQTSLWKSWQPWAAAFGLALPGSFLLMGFSLSVCWSYQYLFNSNIPADRLIMGAGFWLLVSHALLLIAWSWTGGFVIGSVSRRTLWVSIVSSCLPCLFCLARFRESSVSRLCLLLFLAPAAWGIRQGLRINHVKLPWAIVLAAAVTMLMIPTSHEGWWPLNWLLLWPVWYMVAAARKPARETGQTI